MRRTRYILILAVVTALTVLPALLAAQASMSKGEVITFSTTAIGFTSTTLDLPDGRKVTECTGRLEDAQIREYHNGSTPTSTDGMLIEVGDVITLNGTTNIRQFRGIRTGSTDGVIRFQCGAR
jgi:hypothetical protein